MAGDNRKDRDKGISCGEEGEEHSISANGLCAILGLEGVDGIVVNSGYEPLFFPILSYRFHRPYHFLFILILAFILDTDTFSHGTLPRYALCPTSYCSLHSCTASLLRHCLLHSSRSLRAAS